jgi:hypothetical protein
MTRLLTCAMIAALTALVVAAQPTPPKDLTKDAQPGAAAPAPPPNVINLTISPAAAPVPALKYELLPRLRDRTTGNAAIDYYRAGMLRPNWPRDPEESRKQDEMVSQWEEGPIEKLPIVDVKKFLFGYDATFRALDQAARCDRCDWELNRKATAGNLLDTLPEVQQYREITRFNRLRIRLDLAENDYDGAIRGLQSGLRMGKSVAEGPTMIHMLVGIALVGVHTGAAEEWVQRPGSPNLYWALTTLPRPFIDPRPALEGEAAMAAGLFPGLKDLEKGPVSADQANRVLEELIATLRKTAADEDQANDAAGAIGKVGLAAFVALYAADARKQLVELGRPAAEVEKMPPAQVVVLRAVSVHRAVYDDQIKCFHLPYSEGTAELTRARERAGRLIDRKDGDPLVRMFTLAAPAVEKLYHAFARTERRLVGLRVVEAVRLHAAANNGKPPKALSDITLVPVPDDPNRGKPFEYKADGQAFTLNAPPPPGWGANPAWSFRYEVTIRAAK